MEREKLRDLPRDGPPVKEAPVHVSEKAKSGSKTRIKKKRPCQEFVYIEARPGNASSRVLIKEKKGPK